MYNYKPAHSPPFIIMWYNNPQSMKINLADQDTGPVIHSTTPLHSYDPYSTSGILCQWLRILRLWKCKQHRWQYWQLFATVLNTYSAWSWGGRQQFPWFHKNVTALFCELSSVDFGYESRDQYLTNEHYFQQIQIFHRQINYSNIN